MTFIDRLVLGGSHGSARLNEAVPRALEMLAPAIPGLRVLHQAGERQIADTAARYAANTRDGASSHPRGAR